MLNLVLKNKVILEGNMAYLQAFNFFISLLMGKKHQRMLNKANRQEVKSRKEEYGIDNPELLKEIEKRKNYRMKSATDEDHGVKHLKDPYLSGYSFDDFPHIKELHEKHFTIKPEISSERPRLLTEWYRENGFEKDNDGNPWFPELRQAHAYKYLMENKKAVIRPGSLLAGTCSPEEIGVLIYPDTTGTMIWGELNSIEKRVLNPARISVKTAQELHDIFPFWARRTTREWIRVNHNYPLCQKIDERAVASFNFKSVCMSHTVPDIPTFVNEGTNSIIERVRLQIKSLKEGEVDKLNSLQSMMLCLEGLNAYAENLAVEAGKLAEKESDPKNKNKLIKLSEICNHVPGQSCKDP